MIYDTNGIPLQTEPDLTKGWLRDETRTIHHEAVQGVKEVGHYETVFEYDNGGKDVVWVVDTPGVEARDEWYETQVCQVYVPYTQEELNKINQPSEIEQLQQKIDMLTDCIMEMSELVYA